MTHVIDLMSTRTSADFCIESKKRKRSCHHRGPQRLPLGAGLWPAGRGLHMPGLELTKMKIVSIQIVYDRLHYIGTCIITCIPRVYFDTHL